MLTVSRIEVFYGDFQVLRGVSLEIQPGEIVALVGANGAGKTTTLKTLSGLLRPKSGQISFLQRRIDQMMPHEIVELGLVHVPEGRKLFPDMTVTENLELGAFTKHAKPYRTQTMHFVFELFPRLHERRNQRAGTLSGGEQQMLAIGRALMARPQLLLLDEPSLGLAPKIVAQVFDTIAKINRQQGLTILIVEQHVSHVLHMATRGYVLENGQIVLEGKGSELLKNPEMRRAYLGL